MAPTVRASDELLALDLAPRAYNALRRNNVREVGELVSLSASSFFA
jgi:DNA-directed RNA polymerase alpha subunit